MKNKYFILIVLLSIAGIALISCNVDREKKVEDAKENVIQADQELKEAQAQYEKDWQQFKSEAELKIDANQKSIDELKAEIKTASSKFKAKYEKEVLALEKKNTELRKSINEYKYEGKDKWEEFKRDFNNNMDVIGNAIKDIFSKKE
ncbi:MAG: hypothetical protein MUO34_08845 [Ignavibacteriaceae bacterium]|nr:hypothetical protein [Ignavibacteriaceae bacterium]